MQRLNPRSAALAYRIWAYCTPRGWNCTIPEVADELGVSDARVGMVITLKKWNQRMRAPKTSKGLIKQGVAVKGMTTSQTEILRVIDGLCDRDN